MVGPYLEMIVCLCLVSVCPYPQEIVYLSPGNDDHEQETEICL